MEVFVLIVVSIGLFGSIVYFFSDETVNVIPVDINLNEIPETQITEQELMHSTCGVVYNFKGIGKVIKAYTSTEPYIWDRMILRIGHTCDLITHDLSCQFIEINGVNYNTKELLSYSVIDLVERKMLYEFTSKMKKRHGRHGFYHDRVIVDFNLIGEFNGKVT